jgi:hypothetical protein
MAPRAYQPSKPAPMAGEYQELNALGAPTGRMALMAQGDQLPPAPRGFSWRPLSQRTAAELRSEAAQYRSMAATATTTAVKVSLENIADKLEALAEQREREERGQK